jgi:hypothetical protein
MTVVRSHRYDSCWSLEMRLVAHLRVGVDELMVLRCHGNEGIGVAAY